MPEFLQLIPVQQAIDHLLAHMPESSQLATERIPTTDSLGRVIAENIRAPHAMPEFARSTVDGYAVHAADTYGASSSLPAYLTLGAEIRMGRPAEDELPTTHAFLIHTGAMLPPGADAVVMLEDTQQLGEGEVEILRPVASGENVIAVAEDVEAGETVISLGRRIRPQEIGGLMALGFNDVLVYVRPRVGIISSGDEVVPPNVQPGVAQVRDINSYTLKAIVERCGAQAVIHGVVRDNLEALQAQVEVAHRQDQLVVVTAGSSVSSRDLTARVFTALGEPGVLVHGISIKPGKPTLLAIPAGVPVVGLPGNPVSALVVGSLILAPIIDRLYGLQESSWPARIKATLASNVASQAGREDYQPVRLIKDKDNGGVIAEPVYGRSNLIFTLVRSDGLLPIPADSTGLEAGTTIEVIAF